MAPHEALGISEIITELGMNLKIRRTTHREGNKDLAPQF
jgi:hypothetical protein